MRLTSEGWCNRSCQAMSAGMHEATYSFERLVRLSQFVTKILIGWN